MKMEKNNNARRVITIVLVVLAVILAILISVTVFLYIMQGKQTQTPDTETTTAPQSTAAAETTTAPMVWEDMVVSTAFGELVYPGQWAEQIRVEVNDQGIGGSVAYYGTVNGNEEPLFTIYFGKAPESSVAVGSIKVNGMSMNVYVEMNEPDVFGWSREDIDEISAMQEGVNHIIENLKENENFSTNVLVSSTETGAQTDETEATTETGDELMIETPYGNLYLPGEWKEKIRTEEAAVTSGYGVAFYGTVEGREEEYLYTVYFDASSEKSYIVGTMTVDGASVNVSVELGEFDPADSWSVEEINEIGAMQETLNDLLEKLGETSDFTIA